MSPNKLAVLKSLAMRPCANIPASLQPIVTALEAEGYVVNGPSGLVATAKGCRILEEHTWTLSVVRGMTEEHDQRREDLTRQVREQEQLVRRMILRGTPTQADEDRLRALQRQLTDLECRSR